MSDELDRVFARLRGAAPPVPFAAAAAVRRRGRQRRYRHAATLGVAVLAVTGAGAGGLATAIEATDRPGPVPPGATAAPSLPPDPAVVAPDWLLAAADLGPGWAPTSHELFESDPPWYWGELCAEDRLADHPSLAQRRDLATVSWENDQAGRDRRIDQVVELFDAPAAAVANLAEVRAVTQECSRRPAAGDEVAPSVYDLSEVGIVGDEALLVEEQQYAFDGDENGEEIGAEPALLRFALVIRVGAVVTTLISEDEQLLRELAPAAAARLP